MMLLWPASIARSQQTKTSIDYTPYTGDGLPLVRLDINEGPRGNFVIDTGSSSTVISDDMAARLHLKIHPLVGTDGHPHILNGKQAMGDDVTILFGGLKFTGPVFVVPTARLQATRDVLIDGLIGHDLLSHMAVLFDFRNHRISAWFPGGLTPEEISSLQLRDQVTIEMSPKLDGCVVPVVINGSIHIEMRIDTGGGATNIPANTAKELKLKANKSGIHSSTIFGPMITSQAVVDRLEIGALALTNENVEYAKRDGQMFQARLGMNTIGRYVLLIDYPAKRVYFATGATVVADSGTEFKIDIGKYLRPTKNGR